MPDKILFLDRDGVINKRIVNGYVTRWEEFEFLPGVKESLGKISGIGYSLIVITNQQCVGKKMITFADLQMIQEKMSLELQRAGANILDIFVCPHLKSDNCNCRKPKPGLLIQAKEKYGLDLSKTIFIGDSPTDIEAGKAAGTKTFLLSPVSQPTEKNSLSGPDRIFQSLKQAVDFLIIKEKG